MEAGFSQISSHIRLPLHIDCSIIIHTHFMIMLCFSTFREQKFYHLTMTKLICKIQWSNTLCITLVDYNRSITYTYYAIWFTTNYGWNNMGQRHTANCVWAYCNILPYCNICSDFGEKTWDRIWVLAVKKRIYTLYNCIKAQKSQMYNPGF